MRRTAAHLIQAELGLRDCALLVGDVGNQVLDSLRGHPRFINCGASEQLIIALASGLGLAGVFPFVYGIASFLTARALEQIKICLCQQRVPCLLIGTGSGFAYGHLGPTHHSLEDVSALKCLPGLTILAPCDRADLANAFGYALDARGPCYLRLPHEQVYEVAQEPGIGLKRIDRPSPSGRRPFAVVTYGAMVQHCLAALGDDLPFDLYNLNRLKVSTDSLSRLGVYEIVVFVEEAYRTGGFGETFVAHLPQTVRGVHWAVADRFPTAHGSREYLLAQENLDEGSLRAAFRAFCETKRLATLARDSTTACAVGRRSYRQALAALRHEFAQHADPNVLLEYLLRDPSSQVAGLAAAALPPNGVDSPRRFALFGGGARTGRPLSDQPYFSGPRCWR